MSDNEAVETLTRSFNGAVEEKLLNPWCGLCHSKELKYEAAPTRFDTMNEAIPQMREQQAANLAAMAKNQLQRMHESN